MPSKPPSRRGVFISAVNKLATSDRTPFLPSFHSKQAQVVSVCLSFKAIFSNLPHNERTQHRFPPPSSLPVSPFLARIAVVVVAAAVVVFSSLSALLPQAEKDGSPSLARPQTAAHLDVFFAGVTIIVPLLSLFLGVSQSVRPTNNSIYREAERAREVHNLWSPQRLEEAIISRPNCGWAFC